MANIIALVWDFDKTLISGYMQDPIFKEYKIDSKKFWDEVNALPEKYKSEQNIEVNKDTIYLNYFIKKVKDGTLKGLSNQKLKNYGKQQTFYNGVTELFKTTKEELLKDGKYSDHDIKVEHYIVSTGFKKVVEGTDIAKYVDGIWGCEFIEENGEISEIGYAIDNTSKTRALFEINKGINKHGTNINVNTKIPEEARRVHFINMIYTADGPSDVPAFSVTKRNGGATFAIYPHGDTKAFNQVNTLRDEGRVDMIAEADFSEGTLAYMMITEKVKEIADRIIDDDNEKFKKLAGKDVPHHLT